MFKTKPTVFCVGKNYQIIVPVDTSSLFWIEVNGKQFFDASNGIMRSDTDVHKVSVPQKLLDEAKEYTIFATPVLERNACGAVTGETVSESFSFRPVPENDIKAYNISDAHSRVAEPIAAAKAFGDVDLLILSGDILDNCDNAESFMNVYKICSEITGGTFPVVSTRGNHDMRGRAAEKFAEYMPSENGNIFYTFTVGSLWGVVLDCGEITADSDPAYNFTVHCDHFRAAQTEFLKTVVENAKSEYEAPHVKNKIVLVHDPFFERHTPPYDVTRDIFKEWFDVINPNIKPDLWLCGHSHRCAVCRPPYSTDEFGINAPLLMASTPGDNYFKGGAIEFSDNGNFVTFTDSNGTVFEKITL